MAQDNQRPSSETLADGIAPVLRIDDQRNPRTVHLTRSVTRVGRGENNDVVILDGRVSKRHAEVRRDQGHYVIVDVGSKAGVYCNGAAIHEHALEDGDVITLGRSCPARVVFHLDPPTENPAKEPSSVFFSLTETRGHEGLKKLSSFLEFSRALSTRLAPDELLASVIDLALEITGTERGFLILSRPGDQLAFEASRGSNGRALAPDEQSISETTVRQVIADKKPCIVADVGKNRNLANARSVVLLDLGSIIAMPLWRYAIHDVDDHRTQRTDEVFGVLYLDSRKRHNEFDRFDIGILETLARDASAAIENVRLLREAEAKRRIEGELETARRVQASLLPDQYWTAPWFDVAGSCVPCLDLGGDYLDQFRLPDDRTAFVVADVCGKGLSAALLAAAVQGALVSEFATNRPLADIIARVNQVACRLAPVGKFITLVACTLSSDGELRYVNAGHCPLLVSVGEGMEKLVTGGMALGMDASATYEEHVVRLGAGDVAVMYTDGVLEAEDVERELFGDTRLEEAIRTHRAESAEEMCTDILLELEEFRGRATVVDDITLMVVTYQGKRR